MSFRAKDGSGRKVIIEHRIGKTTASFAKKQLLNKVGLEKEWREQCKMLQRRITNAKEWEKLCDALYTSQMKKLGGMIGSYRKFLNNFYGTQGISPCLTYVPVDGSGSFGIYIQALIDEKTRMLVAGEPEDLALWSEVTASREKSHVDMYDNALLVAKGLLRLSSVNKDIQARMQLVTRGEVPNSPFLLHKAEAH